MSNRIEHLYESPCYQCGMQKECDEKVARAPKLQDVVDFVFPRAGYNYKDCILYKVLKMEEKHGK